MTAGGWLLDHVRASLTRPEGPLHWQWHITWMAWTLEHWGLPDAPALQRRLLCDEGGVAASACRQQPYTAWMRGAYHCQPGAHFPSMASLTKAATLDSTARPLSPLSLGRLAALVPLVQAWVTAQTPLQPPCR